MALRPKVLRIKANKVEEKEMKKYERKPQQVCLLDAMLRQHYMVCRPEPNDYRTRKDLVRIFNEIAKEIYGKSGDIPTVVEFGSVLMDLFSVRSDLDLSVNFGKNGVEVTREKKIQTLRKFARKFYALKSQGHVSGVRPVPFARVPILKVVDRGTRIECDLSVENRDGILKSQLIRMICSIDERFQILSFLMKDWANAQKINSSKDGTMNSLSIILIVAFHLQTRTPPVLPPFSSLFKDGTDPASVEKLLSNFVNYGKSNKESVAELFISLLIKLASVEILWAKGLCASVYDGSWTSKTWDSKVAPISVEDFTDRKQNVARAVGAAEIKKIYKCIHNSLKLTFAFMDGHIDGSNLLAILFGKDARLLPVVANSVSMVTQAVPPFPIPTPIHVQDSTLFCAGDVNLSNAAPLNVPPHLTKPIGAQITGGSNSTLTKRQPSSDSREEIASKKLQKEGRVASQDFVLAKQVRCIGDWSGRPDESCWGPNSANWPRRQQESDVSKERPPTNSWGAMHVDVGQVSEAGNLTNANFSPLGASGAKRLHSRPRR